MAQGGVGNQSPATLFQARLLTDNNVGPTLSLIRYQGNKVVVGGLTVTIPQTGLTRDVADNLISAVGADSGAPGVANTLYYVYVSNKKASFSPSSIRLCATPPSLVNGVKYLGTTGNALNWRFVGWVRLNATPNFESSITKRFIVNYYNRFLLSLFTCPGYVNDNAFTIYAVSGASTNYQEANGGVGSRVEFISNGEDDVIYDAQASADNSPGVTANWSVGVGEDSGTGAMVSSVALFSTNVTILQQAIANRKNISEGYHFLAMLLEIANGVDIHVYADGPQFGSVADPPMSYLTASVFC